MPGQSMASLTVNMFREKKGLSPLGRAQMSADTYVHTIPTKISENYGDAFG